jgi:hypothetical protein
MFVESLAHQSAQGSLEAVRLLHMRLTSIHSRLLIVNLFGAEDTPLYVALLLRTTLTPQAGLRYAGAKPREIRYFHLSCDYISMPPSPASPHSITHP